jgi:hypothetical protein
VKRNKTEFKIFGELPPLTLKLTDYFQQRLLNVQDMIYPEIKEEESGEMVSNEKN